jgi:hypothetical protein
MKKNIIFVLSAFVTLSLFAKTPVTKVPNPIFGVYARTVKGDKVNPIIETKFKQQYGALANVSWSIVDDASDEQITIATFSEQGEEKEVYYFEDGEILGIGKSVRRDLLPESVTKSINARFNSGIIQTAYEFKQRNSATRYYVRVVTPRHSMIVSANEFGDTKVFQKEKLKQQFK